MCLISIIVPVYKTETYLERCINSLTSQSYKNLQIILVDDGSPDHCGEICDRYADMDPRIEVIHQENAGVSSARNAGLRIAKGEYIGFVDSDDWISNGMYERLYQNASTYQTDLSVCGFDTKLKNTSYTKAAPIVCGQPEALALLFSCKQDGFKGFLWNKLFKSKIIKDHEVKLQPDISYMEDLLFCFQYLQYCKNICYDNTPLYYYIQRKESVTGSALLQRCFSKQDFDQLRVWDILLRLIHENHQVRQDIEVRKSSSCVELLIKYEASAENEDFHMQSFLKNEIRKNLFLIIRSKIIPVNEKIKALLCLMFPKLLAKFIITKRI